MKRNSPFFVSMINKKKEFEYVFKNHYKKLFSISFRITKNQLATEDIIQEVFLNAWEQNPTSLEDYLVKSVSNRSLNYLRDAKKTIDFNDLTSTQEGTFFNQETDLYDYALLKETIGKTIDDLPPRCKTIFVLCRYEKLKYKEIAELLDISTKTVENQMAIALRKIALDLKPEIKRLFEGVVISMLIACTNLFFIVSNL